MKRFICSILAVIIAFSVFPAVFAENEAEEIRILFTHDIHSHFLNKRYEKNGEAHELGGAARLATLLNENKTENSVYLDAGDFSMGTLLQAGYISDAYELRILGELGCAVTTFGNHEFDYGDEGTAKMLMSAKQSEDMLPKIVQSNIVTDGELTSAGRTLKKAMTDYGVEKYTVIDIGNIKAAVFGLFGIDCLDCTPTTEMQFENYVESAKKTVESIKQNEKADIIICLSHCGTAGDGKTGEDVDLAKSVPDIDIIISGHTHTEYSQTVNVGKTVIVSCGEYLKNLGCLDLSVDSEGVKVKNYKLISCDESVSENEEFKLKMDEYKENINQTYLKDEGVGCDDVICHLDYDFISLDEMSSTHGEYPFGNLIADSYMYEARRNGITDIDVALVGLGTVRDTFTAGDITTSDIFEVCSLGVGKDESAGHPILASYITGKELKLIAELDASFGPMVSYIKMSYSGLRFTFNTKRMLLDRVTDICLVKEDGTCEEIIDTKLYKVCCNMYAANMLGMLNGLTKGILKITPKFKDGTVVENFYDCSLYNKNGDEIKEWIAFKNYLSSFEEKNGVPAIPVTYSRLDNRKNKISLGGLETIRNPGTTTSVVMIVPAVIIVFVVIMILTRKRRKLRRAKRKAKKQGRVDFLPQ